VFGLTPCTKDPIMRIIGSTEAGDDENRHSVVLEERSGISRMKRRNGRS